MIKKACSCLSRRRRQQLGDKTSSPGFRPARQKVIEELVIRMQNVIPLVTEVVMNLCVRVSILYGLAYNGH